MRTFREHQRAVAELLAGLASLPPERIAVDRAARGRVTASDLVAPLDLPPFRNSQMDGFAVRAADLPGHLRVSRPVPAGSWPDPLAAASAAPVMTGAPIPAGADAVIAIERADPDRFPIPGDAAEVRLPAVEPGAYVREAGSDVSRGARLLARGSLLGPAHLGVLAAAGIDEVDVLARPRVLLVSTGDELSPPGVALAPGRIHDANGTSVPAALEEAGAGVVRSAVVPDDPDALRRVLDGATDVDLVVTSGGVSRGAYEVVRDAFERDGIEFVQLALQPAGPQGLGSVTVGDRRIPLVAAPGNPVSALLSVELFLRPVLRSAVGLPSARPTSRAPLATGLDAPGTKHQVRRARLDADGRVHPVGGPGSHLLASYAAATHLAHIPLGTTRLESGDEVEVWRIAEDRPIDEGDGP